MPQNIDPALFEQFVANKLRGLSTENKLQLPIMAQNPIPTDPMAQAYANVSRETIKPREAAEQYIPQEQMQPQTPQVTPEQIQQKYLQTLMEDKAPRPASDLGGVYERIASSYKGAPGQKKSVLRAILGGLTGLAEYAGSSQGMQIIAGQQDNPYKAQAFLDIAKQREAQDQAAMQNYQAEKLKKLSEMGEYVRSIKPLTKKTNEIDKMTVPPPGFKFAYDKEGNKILEELPLGNITPEQFDRETKLRSEYMKRIGDYPVVRDAYARITSSAEDPTAAGDLSMIFSYMKLLDPGSVVRESEYASAENARGVPDTIRNLYNKVLEGQMLAPEQRADFLNRATQIFKKAHQQAERVGADTEEKAKQYQLEPRRVVYDTSKDLSLIKSSHSKGKFAGVKI